MAIIVCASCSRSIEVNGHVPPSCPGCGSALHFTAAATNTFPNEVELPETVVLSRASRAPATLGRYELRATLGSGGFGTVYLAYDPRLDRPVAIKVPDLRGKGPATFERFAREGRSAAQLHHPGIVSIHNVEEDQGAVYIVSEYIEGQPLASQLRKGRIPFRQVASLVAAVASAVEYAHSKGIVHRDIKPGNIMIDGSGNPRLMDFGLAKREEIDPTITVDDQILGTPAYMSPEQARGKRGQIDRRTDIYSLGATLYHVLTNELPFQGEPREVRDKVLTEEPARPRTIDKTIPVDLETICLKAMEKEPARRYQTASELADDLERWLRGEPILARHIGRTERAWRWAKRNPAPAALIASVAALLITITIGSSSMFAIAATHARQLSNSNDELKTALSKSYIEKASRYLNTTPLSDADTPLKALPWNAEAMKLDQNNPDRLLADRIRLQSQLDLAPHIERMWFSKGDAHLAGLSPKRDMFFVAGNDGTVRVWQTAKEGPPIATLPHPSSVSTAAFSPNGELLATGSEEGIWIWELPSGKLRKGPLMPKRPERAKRALQRLVVMTVTFSPSGAQLLTITADRVRQIWRADTWEPIADASDKSQAVTADFADGDRLVVLGSFDGAARVWDWRKKTETQVLKEKKLIPVRATVSPDAVTVASSGDNGVVSVWNAMTAKIAARLVPDAPSHTSYAPRFAPDGKSIAATSSDGVVRVWQSDGHLLWKRQVTSGRFAFPGAPRFSVDGKLIAVPATNRGIFIFDARTGDLTAEPITNQAALQFADWAGGEGRILSVDIHGVARLWNVASNEQPVLLPHTMPVSTAAVSLGRSTLVTAEEDGSFCFLRASKDGRFNADGQVLHRLVDPPVSAIALSDDGSRLAVSSERTVTIWDTETQTRLAGPLIHGKNVFGMSFTLADSKLVSFSMDGRATVWDTATGNRAYAPLVLGRAGGSFDFDIDAQGKRLAFCRPDATKIWDLTTGQPAGSVPGAVFVRFLGPNQLLIADLSKIRIWDPTAGRAVCAVDNRQQVSCLEVSADRKMLLAGFMDGTARVWFSDSGAPAAPAFEHPTEVVSGTIDPSHRWLATVTKDYRVWLWDIEGGQLVFVRDLRYSGPHFLPADGSHAPARVVTAFFSRQSEFLQIVTDQAELISISLAADSRHLDTLEADARLRAGAVLDHSSSLKILEPDALESLWDKVRNGSR